MSVLAHAAFGRKKTPVERRNIDTAIQDEIACAKRIQAETQCIWSDALRRAKSNFSIK